MSSNNANLKSPNYPNDYGGPWNCGYLIEAATGEIIDVTFQTPFIVEKYYDFIWVRNNVKNISYKQAKPIFLS